MTPSKDSEEPKKYILISLLSVPFDDWESEIRSLEKINKMLVDDLKLSYNPIKLHFDVIDESYKPEKISSMDMHRYEQLVKSTYLICDLHLMVKDPDLFLQQVDKDVYDRIFIHYKEEHGEYTCHAGNVFPSTEYQQSNLRFVHNPDQLPLQNDDIMIMTVWPGKGGQKMIKFSQEREKDLEEKWKTKRFKSVTFDGGIDEHTIENIKHLGNGFVIGSAYFKQEKKERFNYLRRILFKIIKLTLN